MTDPFQPRYVAHQRRKAAVLAELLLERHSQRAYADRPVTDDDLVLLLNAAAQAASSCDRHGVAVAPVRDRDAKALLGGLLVGGVGWIHRAPVILLLQGDRLAYKAGDEITYMPFLDAGVMVGQMQLAAAAAGLASCYVNPNIREPNRAHMAAVFGDGVFCGALAVGWPRGSDPARAGNAS